MSVMPMGRSHALYVCQLLHTRIIQNALPEIPLLVDDAPAPVLHRDTAVASVYVDIF